MDATELWRANGKPCSGEINANRCRIKLRYKNAIKDAASSVDATFNHSLYDHLCKKDTVGFWKAWRKRFCVNNLKPTCVLNGKSGSENVHDEFTEHFKGVFTPNDSAAENSYKKEINSFFSSHSGQFSVPFIHIE